ncbi:uncharacterized protein [Aquarana catesbeiana]|uniref:uncharacterized protein n=1 Tax=Aquarana catesbeiana TaxID=8400 RepID=UPI003CC92956
MTTSVRMEEDRSHMTEKILNLILEIIYLLTGERFPLVKSGDHMTITVPPCDSLKPERHNMEKILEVTKKMMEMLTGEVPIRCQDVTVYFSMEEWEYLEGHKDLYKDVMMDNQPPLTSPDGSSNGNPPERCLLPLYSWDSTQEGHTIPHHHQSRNLEKQNIGIKEEEEEEYGAMDKKPKDMMEPTSNRNPPERCPRPLYSWDFTQEDHTIPHHHQGEDLIIVKVEGEVEETYVRDYQQYMEEAGMMRTSIEEDTPTEISTGRAMKKPSKYHPTLSPGYRMEDEDITGDCGGEKTMSSTMDGGLHSVDRPWNPSDSEQPRTVRDGAGIQMECWEDFTSQLSLAKHQKSQTAEKQYSCSECGKWFLHKSTFLKHYRSHTGEKPFSCSECGKCFSQKAHLSRHQRLHTGEKPYVCPECGKRCAQKSELETHQRSHTRLKPYTCPECGKSFSHKSYFSIHQKLHTAEKFFCPKCGKSYTQKSELDKHQRSHSEEKPYSCPVCEKCFSRRSSLYIHQRLHTGKKPYSCSDCGKCFSQKTHLIRHQRSHTGEKPYSCPECGKRFSQKSHFNVHQLYHTGEKPFSCLQCGKSYSQKSELVRHQKSHTEKKPYSCPE